MDVRFKAVLVKSSILITGLLVLVSVLFFPVISVSLGYTFEETEKLWIACWIITVLSCIIMVLLIFIVGISLPKVTAEKKSILFNDYDTFLSFFQKKLENEFYLIETAVPISLCGEIILHIKKSSCGKFDCVAIIRIPEISNEFLDTANKIITQELCKYCRCNKLYNTVNMISVFCVDRVTPVFRRVLNSNARQGIKNGRLVVGISFGGRNVYIARQNDGFAISRYNRLRKKFMDMMSEKMI